MDISPPRSLAEGPEAPPMMGNQPDPQGGWTPALTAPPAGANDAGVAQADADVRDSQKGVTEAKTAYDNAYKDYQAALQAPVGADPLGDKLKIAKDVLDNTATNWTRASTAEATAWARVKSGSEAAASRADNPYHNAYYAGHAQQAQAGADLARAQAASLTAKTDDERKLIVGQTAEAAARAQSLGILSPAQAAQAHAQAGELASQAQQRNTLTPLLARQEAAKATVAEAGAGLAVPTAQASLDKAQADADKARADVNETTRRIAAMPTEQQAQAAIYLGLKDKQADLDAKSLQLEQAKKLMPIAVGQAGANVAATEAGTAATLAGIGQKTLGARYGIGDQISRYRDMIGTGQINPQDADTALNSYLNTQVQGATPYQIGQEQNRYAEAMRQQDIGLTENRLNAAQQYAGNVLGQYAQMAASAGPGHGQEAAQAYLDTLQQGQRFFGQMGGMVTPPTVPSAVSQAPVVHINIGGGQPTSASQPTDVMAGLPAAPPPLPAMTAAPPPAPSGMPRS